jgi:hypothetical protein
MKHSLIILFVFTLINSSAQNVFRTISLPNTSLYVVSSKKVDNNSFIVEGATSDHRILISKFNTNGDSLWSFIIYGDISLSTYGQYGSRQLAITPDKGCVFSYLASNKYQIIKIDSTGNFQWGHEFNSAIFGSWINRLIVTRDSSIVIFMGAHDLSYNYPSIIKLNSNGDTMFQKLLGSEFDNSYGSDMYESSDGSYYFTNEVGINLLDSNFNSAKSYYFNINWISGESIYEIGGIRNDTIFALTSSWHLYGVFSIIIFDTSGTFCHYIHFNNISNMPEVMLKNNSFYVGTDRDTINIISEFNYNFDTIQTYQFHGIQSNQSNQYIKPVFMLDYDSSFFVLNNVLDFNSYYSSIQIVQTNLQPYFCNSSPAEISYIDSSKTATMYNNVSLIPADVPITHYSDTMPLYSRGFYLGTNCISTSINEINNSFKFYPNPTNDEINVTGMNESDNLEIINIYGQKLNSIKTVFQDGILKINISSILGGVYYLIINNRFKEKFIKL